jgi:16S rRNA processing protein RimM
MWMILQGTGSWMPFFIEKIQMRNDSAVVKLEGIDTTERAADLLKAQLWLPLSALPPLTGNQFYYHEVIGFTVMDETHGNIGIVESVLDFPQQAILQVKKGDKEILVPVRDHILKKVDRKSRVIEVSTPDGLIDLYLGNLDDEEDKEENSL